MMAQWFDRLNRTLRKTPRPPVDGPDPRRGDAAQLPLLRLIADRLLETPADRERFFRSNAQYAEAGQTDYFFGADCGRCEPGQIFDHLRWGGQFIFASPRPREVEAVLARYRNRPEFEIEREPQTIEHPRIPGVPGLPFLRRRQTYFVARKVMITQVGVPTSRYSYDVRLERTPRGHGGSGGSGGPGGDGYVVAKQVPTQDQVVERLVARFPNNDPAVIRNTARKLSEKVFPVFLTREAALLKLLQRDAPEPYRDRFPVALHIEKDGRGFVTRLEQNWLRQGGETMSQLEFARQSADLLAVLHDRVGVIHLDLRLDNMVITPRGVNFVDFGSGIRVGEDFSNNPLLRTLFSEMLSTSQIQRDLRRLVRKNKVTSRLFIDAADQQKMDKAVDLFYLVLQMNNPHANPDFRGLVHFDRDSDDARRLAALSRRVFNPRDTDRDRFTRAADVLRSLETPDPAAAG